MRFQARYIGDFTLTDGEGRNVLPGMRKTRAVVARILLAAGQPVPRDALIALAWKDREVEQGRASLRQALYEARSLTIGPHPLIHITRTAARMDPAVLDNDLDQLFTAARNNDLDTLTQALAAGVGPILADLDGISPGIDAWLAGVREERRAALREAVGEAAKRAVASGRNAQAQALLTLLGEPDAAQGEKTGGAQPAARWNVVRSWGRIRLGLPAVGVALMVLLAGAAMVWRLGASTPHRLLAVEPLQAEIGDGPALAVQRGLSGDLTHALVANPARITVDQIGAPGVRSIDADLVVSGDVATLGGRLQAHVQLASARAGAILWASDFDGDPAQPDVLREQIATKADAVINCALSTRHGGAAKISDEANRLYLKACDLIEQYRLPEALQPLRQVTALEPGFARAWADLATTEALTVDASEPARQKAGYREAEASARRALALDPKTGLAFYALAQTLPGITNWQRRVTTITRGLTAEPDGSELNNAMASELMRVGRCREAIIYFRRSMASDPLNPVKTATLFSALAFNGQYDEAERLIDRSLQLWPRNPVIWERAFAVELRAGNPKRADIMLGDPDRPAIRDPEAVAAARRWIRVRQDPTAKNVSAALEPLIATTLADPHDDHLPTAVRMAELGRLDAGYRLALDPAAEDNEDNDWLLFNADLSQFRRDKRFMKLASLRGLRPIWQSTGAWPDFCGGLPRGRCE